MVYVPLVSAYTYSLAKRNHIGTTVWQVAVGTYRTLATLLCAEGFRERDRVSQETDT
jgi:hypothetical protein